jgi:hypothetical protein
MADLLRGVLFKAIASLLQEFRGHAQVHLRGPDMDMAEINRQEREQPLHIRALPIPGGQPVNGEGVP